MTGLSADAVVRSRAQRVARAALFVGLVGFPVLLLVWVVRAEFAPVLAVDQTVLGVATDLTRRWGLLSALLVVQTVGHPIVVNAAVTLVAAWAWVAKGMRGRAIWAFATVMVGWVLGEVMKLLVQRVRPVLEPSLSSAPGYSFPSGHALNITVAVTVVLVLLWPVLSPPLRVLAVGLAVLAALVVGLDRILLGVHYPSDVVAGYVLGCCITFSSWAGFSWRMGGTFSSASSDPP